MTSDFAQEVAKISCSAKCANLLSRSVNRCSSFITSLEKLIERQRQLYNIKDRFTGVLYLLEILYLRCTERD